MLRAAVLFPAVSFALAFYATGSTSAIAGCTDEVVAHVAFAPGRVCWIYRGPATVFAGAFGSGQRITVQMGGGRTPSATGPGGFSLESNGAALAFNAPRSGTYRFSFYPCALWGSSAPVQVCAR